MDDGSATKSGKSVSDDEIVHEKDEPKKEDKDKDESGKDEQDSSSSSSEKVPSTNNSSVENLRRYLIEKLGFQISEKSDEKDESDSKIKLFDPLTFDGFIKHWNEKGFKNIVTMVGAGISTSAGIPDFRSPDTGLYNNLQKYKLPYPTAIFQLDYFRSNPKPFFSLAKELYPGQFKPTPGHYFVRLLDEKGLLLRHYTQNIDTLERVAEIDGDKIVEAHGTFYTSHCLKCRKEYDLEWTKDKIFNDKIPHCDTCRGLVKPDIVFFGENLPDNFYELPEKDFKHCDLLIIMGTSLEVQPFASLINRVNRKCVRLLINREKVGHEFSFWDNEGLKLDSPENTRDVAWLGDCDEGVQLIADKLGFGDELRELIKREHDRIDQGLNTVSVDKRNEENEED